MPEHDDKHARVARALQEHQPALRRLVQQRVPPQEVDDVMQMAAVRALRRCASLNDASRVRAWLFTIHRNLCTDVMRQRARHVSAVAPDIAAEAVPDVADAAVDACDCITVQAQKLRPNYASMLRLVDADGASLAQVATALGITVNNATVRLHRARAALRQAMQEHCGVQTVRDCWDCRCHTDACCVA